MNSSALDFSLIAVGLVALALLVLDVLSGAQGIIFAAFAPILLWAVVLVVKRRGTP